MATLPEKIELQVVTPERHILSEEVDSLELPAKDGYMGVLPGHAPLITELGVGILTYHKGGETRYLTAMYGYAEVLPDRVIVLAEIAERAEEIDVARARTALERAKSESPKAGSTEAEWDQSNARIQRAETRLQAASRSGSGGGSGTAGLHDIQHAAA
jgi:F-type H+-transporting ATPase subunit epsilon